MKRIILLSLILLIAVSSINACDKKPQTHTKLTPEKLQKLQEDIWGEPAILLGCKYNVDTGKVLGLLIDLDNYNDKGHDITKDKLLSYSRKYQIKINVIAAIIIDLRSMSHPDCS